MADMSQYYEALRKADAAGNTADAKKLAAFISSQKAITPQPQIEQAAPDVTAADRTQAVGAGANRGIASILGLPVDTALNLWDLAKAGVGTAQGAITGKAPSDVFSPADRSRYYGSSEQISNLMNQTPVTTTEMSRPDDTASRYLYAAGAALPNVAMNPSGSSLAANVLPSLAAQGAHEAFPNSTTAPILASLLTQAAPSAVSYGAKKIAQNTIGKNVDASTKEAAATLENAGVKLDNAQKTGKLAGTKASLNDNPFFAAGQADKIAEQKQQYTRAVLRTIGEDADLATPEVMARAESRIGQTISDISERTPVKYNNSLHTSITDVLDEAKRSLQPGELQVLQNQVAHLQSQVQSTKAGALIDGVSVQGSRSELGALSANGGTLGHYAGKLQSVIDDAIQQNAKGDDYSKLQTARKQYRAMLQITPAIDKQGDGLISPARLANSIPKGNAGKKQFYYERGDHSLVDLAKAGNKLLIDKVPNSGTPYRMMRQALPGAVAAAGTGLVTGNPLPAIGIGAGYYGIPKLQQQIVNNPNLLTPEGMPNSMSILQKALLLNQVAGQNGNSQLLNNSGQ